MLLSMIRNFGTLVDQRPQRADWLANFQRKVWEGDSEGENSKWRKDAKQGKGTAAKESGERQREGDGSGGAAGLRFASVTSLRTYVHVYLKTTTMGVLMWCGGSPHTSRDSVSSFIFAYFTM